MKNQSVVVAVLSHLTGTGEAYLTGQADNIQRKFGVRIGKSGILRGLCEGLAECGLDLSDSPTPHHIAAKLAAALGEHRTQQTPEAR